MHAQKSVGTKMEIDAPSRTLTVMQFCLSQSWGGLEMYPPRVCSALQARGHQVHAVALTGSRVADGFKKAGVPVIEFESTTKALLSIPFLLKYIRSHGVQILHANKSGDMRLAAALVQFAPNLRLFFTDHMGVTKPKKDLYHRWAYSKVTRLFSISQATYERNLKAFPLRPERIEQLYYGIDFSAYQQASNPADQVRVRQSLGVPSDGVLIALPGRISPGKGHEIWLRSLGELARRQVALPWHGVIIGEANDEDAKPGGYKQRLLDLVAELGLQDKVTFAGFRSDMPQCLEACDIAAIPSVNEAFGLSVIEAMVARCVVVGADSGAIPELVGSDRGMLAEVTSPSAWANCFEMLIGQPVLRERLSSVAREWVLKNFSMDVYIKKLTEHYRAALLG